MGITTRFLTLLIMALLLGCGGKKSEPAGTRSTESESDSTTDTLAETATSGDTNTSVSTDDTASSPTDSDILTDGVLELYSIDDFEDGDNVNLLGGLWMSYDDRHEGGTSQVTPESYFSGGTFVPETPGFGGSGFAAHISGTTGDVFSWDYLGIVSFLHPDAVCPLAHPIDLDLSQYDGIQFMVKGSAAPGQLYVKFPHKKSGEANNCTTNPIAANSLTRFCDYESSFYTDLNDEWTLVRVPFRDFEQANWGPAYRMTDVLAEAKEMVWEYKVSNGKIDLWIDNVALYKAPNDTDTVYPHRIIDESMQSPLLGFGTPESILNVTNIPVEGQSFTVASHAQINSEPQAIWDALLYAPTSTAILREDLLHAEFFARCATPPTGSDTCKATFLFQESSSPYTQSVAFPITVNGQWTSFSVPFYAEQSYQPAEANILFFLGYPAQTIEIGGLSVSNYGHTKKPTDFITSTFSYKGREADAPWRTAAAERIEAFRKGDLTIQVADGSQTPMEGASVTIEQKGHHFGFGTAINSHDLDNGLSGTDLENYQRGIGSLFNTVVLENALKWPQLYGVVGEKVNLPLAQKTLDWTETQNLKARGHNLVWPGWNNLPTGLKRDYDAKLAAEGEAAAASFLEAEIEAHIQSAVTLFQGRLQHWDVVNEPYDNHDLMDILGKETMAKWFEAAKAADPSAKLFINEYSVLARKITSSASRQNLYDTVSMLVAANAPIDGIGFESHFDEDLTSPEEIFAILEQFAGFGKELWVTEFDLPAIDPALAADYTRDFMTILFSHPKAGGFMMWGFWDGNHYGRSASIYDMLWTEKPSGQVYRDLVFNQWHTSTAAATDSNGVCTTRAFFGEYDVTVTINGVASVHHITFTPETTTPVTITLP